ncbi:MAG: glycosyltransferase family 39 protein [Methylacidiphilales bacterium]|nr:glycosyltransferase family 39 protein [Candidatus Methylacidiphilales bacterium]
MEGSQKIEERQDGCRNAMQKAILILLFAAWLLPGLFGREPWKADEAYSFGLVFHIAKTGDLIVPTLGGEPFMEKPPLLYATAAGFMRLLAPPFQPYEAARLSIVLFHLITFVCLGCAGRLLYGPGKGWIAPLLLIASPGLLHIGHMMVTDIALLAGMAMAYLGLAMALRRPLAGGLLLGAGTGIAFLSKGLIGPGVLGLTCLLLPVVSGVWRTRGYWASLAVAVISALPWVLIWPALLYERSPDLFAQWFWVQNLGRFTGQREATDHVTYGFYFVQLLWFALPGFPLMLWTLWKEKIRGWTSAEVSLPLAGFLVLIVVLTLSGQKREIYGLPLLLPIALLGTRHLESLPDLVCRGWRLLILIAFSPLAAFVWLGWVAQLTHVPGIFWQFFHSKIPDYQLAVHGGMLAAALIGTGFWIFVLLGARSARPFPLLINWTAGLALIYLLVMTLWLPTINWDMSYRKTFVDLRQTLGGYSGPVGSRGLGEPQRALLEYYAGLQTRRAEVDAANYAKCDVFLMQGDYRTGNLMGPPPEGSWRLFWEGRRSGKESYRLYRKTETNIQKPLKP